jgi:hypothetical protein
MKYCAALLCLAALALARFGDASAQASPTRADCAQAWASVQSEGTLSGYQNFLAFFATCSEADKARDAIKTWGTVGGARGATVGGGGLPVAYQAVGQLLTPDAKRVAIGGGYGVVLLRGGGRRNAAACRAFTRAMAFSQAASDQPILVDGVLIYSRPVYWFIRAPIAQPSTCTDMLAQYDQVRADILLNRVAKARGEGPFLAMLRGDGRQVGLFDFSDVPIDEFEPTYRDFMMRVSQSVDIWEPQLYVEATFKQRMRTLLNETSAPATRVIASITGFATDASAATPP